MPGKSNREKAIQRKVIIKFEEPEHEMEEIDTIKAQIVSVDAGRDHVRVSTENKFPNGKQDVHVTSNVVFTSMFERRLHGMTCAQAWAFLQEQYQFLYDLLDLWYSDQIFKEGANTPLKKQLPGLIQAGIDKCKRELTRDGHQIGDNGQIPCTSVDAESYKALEELQKSWDTVQIHLMYDTLMTAIH